MRFHLFGTAHQVNNLDRPQHGFATASVWMGDMLALAGHETVFYGAEGSTVPCKEFVRLLGADELPPPSPVTPKATETPWVQFISRGQKEFTRRYETGDIALLSFGHFHRFVAELCPLAVEFCCGYSGIFANHKVFPSYTWMHYLYGEMKACGKPNVNDVVIPHPLKIEDFPEPQEREDYLLFVGRVVPDKGIQVASDVAKITGLPLVVAGHAPAGYRHPVLDENHVRHVGTVPTPERNRLMGRARAVIMPTQYIEPFGYVAVEAMACGTPVLTTDWGAFPETVANGITGFRCRGTREFAEAVNRLDKIDGKTCRQWVADRFDAKVVWPQYDQYFRRINPIYRSPN